MEEAIASGIVHDVLAELVDVLYLTPNLGQECALMTGMMWMANVVGNTSGRKPKVTPVHLPRLIDDPVTTLEQTVVDLRIA